MQKREVEFILFQLQKLQQLPHSFLGPLR